jgi:hypothetical protein
LGVAIDVGDFDGLLAIVIKRAIAAAASGRFELSPCKAMLHTIKRRLNPEQQTMILATFFGFARFLSRRSIGRSVG